MIMINILKERNYNIGHLKISDKILILKHILSF